MAENTPPPTQGLVKKLAEVMAHADRIPKLGRNVAQGYEYARASDVLAEVRKELANRFVFVSHEVTALEWRTLETKNGKVQIATVHMTLTAHDGESGQSLAFAKTIGEGMDYGDKQSGKALTGAMKYGILNGFMIPTGDDPENDSVPAPGKRASSGRPNNEGTAGRGGATPSAPNSAPTVFPSFGKARGEPIKGAAADALEFHLANARKSLADPEKAKWHARDSALIGAIEAELARQRGAVPEGQRETKSGPKTDADVYEEAAKLLKEAPSLERISIVLRRAFDSGRLNADQRKALDILSDKRITEIRAFAREPGAAG